MKVSKKKTNYSRYQTFAFIFAANAEENFTLNSINKLNKIYFSLMLKTVIPSKKGEG